MNQEISLSQLENIPLLMGGRSIVKFLTDPSTNKKYVVKMVPLSNDSLHKEYELVQKFNHSNIIKPIRIGTLNKNNYLITEYMNWGDLFIFVTKNQEKLFAKTFQTHKFFEKFWRSIFLQCLEAVLHMKSHGWAHLDIKPENFLINSDFEIKVIDFEFAQEVDNKKSSLQQCYKFCGTKSYFSPEIKEKKFPYDPFKSDVFSLAVTMINLMTGIDIFSRNIGDLNAQYIYMKNNDFIKFWKNFPKASCFSVELKALFEKMLKFDPVQRINLEEAKKDVWFQKETFSKEEIISFFKEFDLLKKIIKEDPNSKCSKKVKI